MNKTPRLSSSGIEYLDYSWGIWSGCRNIQAGICPVTACWAKGIATRYPKLYPNGFEPTFYPLALDSPRYLKKPSIISVGWVGDVIGYSSPAVRIAICDAIKACPQHTFMFLTKNPERLKEWAFPNNCWVGVTATDTEMLMKACSSLEYPVEARLKYISIEPFLEWSFNWNTSYLVNLFKRADIGWVILGSQSKPYRPPKWEWVKEIISACVDAGIPYFLKNNLEPIVPKVFGGDGNLIQEMPLPPSTPYLIRKK